MKILLLSSSNNIENGYGNITHEYCSYLLKKGVDFKLLLPVDEPRYSHTNYPVEYVLPPYIFNTKTKKFLKYLFFVYKTDADIVHSLFEFPYGIIGAKIAKKFKKPFIVGTQGTYAIRPLLAFPDKIFTKWMYNAARFVITPSKFTADSIRAYATVKPPIKIIHNGVNFKRFDVVADTQLIQEKYKGKKLLITVGGIKPRKGQDVVLKALGILKKKRDDFHYLIIGPDEKRSKYQNELEELISQNNLEKNVTFTGAVAGDELIKYFQAAYLYVHTPRLIHWNFEGFGIVYLEASASKRPIVAGDSGGIRDAVVDGKTGIVVPENDPEATATAIEKLLNDPGLAEKMGQAGYEYARAHDWTNIAAEYAALYNELQ
jgi:phosphatidylinositol alpha-1,6-mannosyltransferase